MIAWLRRLIAKPPESLDEADIPVGILSIHVVPRELKAHLGFGSLAPFTPADLRRDLKAARRILRRRYRGWSTSKDLRYSDGLATHSGVIRSSVDVRQSWESPWDGVRHRGGRLPG